MTVFLKDYSIQEMLHSTRFTTIYRGVKNADKSSVILKVVKREYVNEKFRKKYRNEFNTLKKIDSPLIIKVYELVSEGSNLALVLEPFSSRSLTTYIKEQPWDLKVRLQIAIQIAEAVGEIHQKHIIHKDIKPHNLLIDDTNRIKLIDFGISTSLMREMPQYIEPEYLEGTLSYISPEQTARMARIVDYRTDIYSLGVTLYHLFTGELPFAAKTPMELVHLHITQRPIPPREVNPDIPKVVSDIILKCMEKNVENRYKSAFGLKIDLEKCLSCFDQTGKIPSFLPGEKDFYDSYHTPEKIYGRQKELAIIKECLDKVWAGELHLLELSGYSGIGKSSLVMESRSEILQRGGRFAVSKFDQFKKNVAFYAISQVIKVLIHQMLMEPEAKLNQWKERLLLAVGSHGQIVIDLVSDVKLVIGEQPPVDKLPPQETENRFKYVMTQFIRALARQESPLVVFFDDFQWCDEASLRLLKDVLGNSNITHFLVIIAYRDNEVTPLHPLMIALKEWLEQGIGITHLHVGPLANESVEQITLEIFSNLAQKDLKELCQLVEEKTHGNPFFVIQFLKYLYDKELIQFNRELLSWKVDIAAISSLEISENVVDLLIEKLEKSEPELLELMQIGSVIGSRFELETLTSFTGKEESQIITIIHQAIHEEYISQETFSGETQSQVIYRFTHDRIQQAFYSLINEHERIQLHYAIGRSLLQSNSPEKIDQILITIVNHLNYGLELPLKEDQKKELLELNAKAGAKLKASQAFLSAITFLKNGILLLDPDSWKTQYELAFSLHNNLAISLQLSGNVEGAQELLELCLSHEKDKIKQVELYIEMIYLMNQKLEYDKALDYAKKAFDVLNHPFEKYPSKLSVIFHLLKIKFKLSRYSDSDLKNLNYCTDVRLNLIATLYPSIINAVYKSGNRLLWIRCILEVIYITLDNGLVIASPSSFSAYGAILVSEKIGDYDNATKYGLLSLYLVKRCKASYEIGVEKFVYINWVYRWKHPIKSSLPFLREAHQDCIENGNIAFAATALYIIALIHILIGTELETLVQEIQTYLKEVRRLSAKSEEMTLLIFMEVCKCLLGKKENVTECCPNELIDELKPKQKTIPNRLDELYYYLLHGFLLFLFNQYDSVKLFIVNIPLLIDKFSGNQLWPLTYLYSALTLAAEMKKLSDNKNDWHEILRLYKQLVKWSSVAPMNYAPHALMVQGEIARLNGNGEEAIRCYDEAVQIARREENPLLAAIGYEVFARYYIHRLNKELASHFLNKAVYYFNIIGATAKVKSLGEYYAEYFIKDMEEEIEEEIEATMEEQTTMETEESTSVTSSLGVQQTSFDLNTVVEASQSLSKEINLDRLMESLMRLMIISAGATKASLILFEDSKPVVHAEIVTKVPYYPLPKSIPLEERKDNLSVAIIDYVIRTKTELVLNHVQASTSAFHDDPYIVKIKPKSVLCFPILQANDLKGILYLENGESVESFTPKRLHLLSLLSSQIAISIENAQFYSKLENKVEARTRELQEKNFQLKEALKHIQEVQEQLIQQEKLASLGLLTAGIAHELKNPLNFVINYSQIAKDQLRELLLDLKSGNEKEQTHLINEIIENLDIIDNHGMRANNIIRGMLSHSHQGTKSVESIDTNALIEQGIDLAYYSYRKKDPDFQMEIIKKYGKDLPEIAGYSGELMRVFINLVDNACYAMSQKNKKEKNGYKPRLEITTSNEENGIQITFKDNGTGISKESIDKVFNPFYTEKPTGMGTGLGLSISYDIIVKQHGGTFVVRSEPNVMTEFVITLPYS